MAKRKKGVDPTPQEPTVLEWLKSVLRLRPIPIPEEIPPEAAPKVKAAVTTRAKPKKRPAAQVEPPVEERISVGFKAAYLRLPLALILAMWAQFGLEQHTDRIGLFLVLYGLAFVFLGWAIWRGDLPQIGKAPAESEVGQVRVRLPYLVIGLGLALLTYLVSGNNRFNLSTLVYWSGALICVMLSLWEGEIGLSTLWGRVRTWLDNSQDVFRLDRWRLLVLFSFLLVTYFRLANLNTVPYDMTSDHAEKLLDVADVLDGNYSIYFPRNTGREALQFYLAAATSRLLGTGISFITLKIGTALIGLLTLPYIYLFGREVGGREVGLTAMLLAGVAYWPNTISRLGLRFPLYPLFVAPVFYHLVRGLRLKNRNHILLAGLFTGIGLHGYSPARVIVITLVVGLLLYALHRQSSGHRIKVIGWMVAAGMVVFVVFLPLLRVAIDMPDLFLLRTITRIGITVGDIPGSPLKIFLSNVWRGLTMFGWDDGEIWVVSIPHRPALDWITGALFHLGIVFAVIRYVRERDWLDLFLLLTIPILMLPSTLSLAFPGENPAPNRAAGAMVPVFTLAAIPLAIIPKWAREQWRSRRVHILILGSVLGLFGLAASMNYRLVLEDFSARQLQGRWNTTDVGGVVRGFAESVGSFDTAHVVPFPHWMDTRLVGMVAGQPRKDYALWPDAFETLLSESRPQLFILHPQDLDSLNRLQELFPSGIISHRKSVIEGKDFVVFFVPHGTRVDLDSIPLSEG